MRNQNELLAMTGRARPEELRAKDQGRLSGADTTWAEAFAAGAEAMGLWTLGHIGEIPFPTVEHVQPSGNGPEDQVDAMLDNLPGIGGNTDGCEPCTSLEAAECPHQPDAGQPSGNVPGQHLCDEECGDPEHPRDGRVTGEAI